MVATGLAISGSGVGAESRERAGPSAATSGACAKAAGPPVTDSRNAAAKRVWVTVVCTAGREVTVSEPSRATGLGCSARASACSSNQRAKAKKSGEIAEAGGADERSGARAEAWRPERGRGGGACETVASDSSVSERDNHNTKITKKTGTIESAELTNRGAGTVGAREEGVQDTSWQGDGGDDQDDGGGDDDDDDDDRACARRPVAS